MSAGCVRRVGLRKQGRRACDERAKKQASQPFEGAACFCAPSSHASRHGGQSNALPDLLISLLTLVHLISLTNSREHRV